MLMRNYWIRRGEGIESEERLKKYVSVTCVVVWVWRSARLWITISTWLITARGKEPFVGGSKSSIQWTNIVDLPVIMPSIDRNFVRIRIRGSLLTLNISYMETRASSFRSMSGTLSIVIIHVTYFSHLLRMTRKRKFRWHFELPATKLSSY